MRHFSLTDIRAVDVRGTQLPKAISEDRVRQSVFDVLDSSLLCSMATVTPDGNVHISTAYFSFSYQLELFFWSHPEALHCRNVRDNGSMAMTIFSTQQPWGSPGRGVQLFAPAR
jgi:Pyridoxamine 5'-phosphate oxidase